MHGVDPYAYLQQVSVRLGTLRTREEIDIVLDEVEYLYEVMDPELHYLADDLIGRLRQRLRDLS
jgi:hypothetical protein